MAWVESGPSRSGGTSATRCSCGLQMITTGPNRARDGDRDGRASHPVPPVSTRMLASWSARCSAHGVARRVGRFGVRRWSTRRIGPASRALLAMRFRALPDSSNRPLCVASGGAPEHAESTAGGVRQLPCPRLHEPVTAVTAHVGGRAETAATGLRLREASLSTSVLKRPVVHRYTVYRPRH